MTKSENQQILDDVVKRIRSYSEAYVISGHNYSEVPAFRITEKENVLMYLQFCGCTGREASVDEYGNVANYLGIDIEVLP